MRILTDPRAEDRPGPRPIGSGSSPAGPRTPDRPGTGHRRPVRRVGARRIPTGPVQPAPGGASRPRPDGTVKQTRAARWGMRALITLVGLLLAVVVVVPLTLSSQDLVRWAHSPIGLGLESGWAILVFVALDAAAAACVGMSVYCAWRGETAGMFGILVWAFAVTSAFANYRFNQGGRARDAVWFFPAMSIAGPLLLEIVIRRVRRWVQTSAGRYEHPLPHFRLARWIPGIGAARETYGAWRTAILDGRISTPDLAVARFRQLCPDGRPRVVRAMRVEAAQAALVARAEPVRADANRPALSGPLDRPGPVDAIDASREAALISLRPAIAAHPATRRRIKPASQTTIRAKRPARPATPARAGDAEALDRLAERHGTQRPGKSAIARTLGVGGPKATRLAAVVARLPEWPPPAVPRANGVRPEPLTASGEPDR